MFTKICMHQKIDFWLFGNFCRSNFRMFWHFIIFFNTQLLVSQNNNNNKFIFYWWHDPYKLDFFKFKNLGNCPYFGTCFHHFFPTFLNDHSGINFFSTRKKKMKPNLYNSSKIEVEEWNFLNILLAACHYIFS